MEGPQPLAPASLEIAHVNFYFLHYPFAASFPFETLRDLRMPMNSEEINWTLVRTNPRGEPCASWKLKTGKTTLGRDAENTILLDDTSVSRSHAEIEINPEGIVSVRELKAKNGIKINGFYRNQAVLQPGDRISLGNLVFQLLTSSPIIASKPSRLSETSPKLLTEPPTMDSVVHSEHSGGESRIQKLLELCSLLVEGCNSGDSLRLVLRLLRESFSCLEAQIYQDPSTGIEFVNVGEAPPSKGSKCSKSDSQPSIRVADFLAELFRKQSEATVFLGKEIGRHQTGFHRYNFLVGPLGSLGRESTRAAFLLLLKPTDYADFTPDDRGRLQLICKMWTRSQSKSDQVQGLRRENSQLSAELKQRAGVPDLIGESESVQTLRSRALRAATNPNRPVILLAGENGTGKEVVAHLIQRNSPRADKPFVICNVAAIPGPMIESDLFGHGGKSYTGAGGVERRGKFVLADGGTIFLDEIGELPLDLQPKFLRAIEYGEIQPLGSEKIVKVQVQIIAATNRDLKQMVESGKFREDLYYRLNVLPLRIPPLRERKEDLPALAIHLLSRCSLPESQAPLDWTPAALETLKKHSWPGNVRELYSVVQRCVAYAAPPSITESDVLEALDFETVRAPQ